MTQSEFKKWTALYDLIDVLHEEIIKIPGILITTGSIHEGGECFYIDVSKGKGNSIMVDCRFSLNDYIAKFRYADTMRQPISGNGAALLWMSPEFLEHEELQLLSSLKRDYGDGVMPVAYFFKSRCFPTRIKTMGQIDRLTAALTDLLDILRAFDKGIFDIDDCSELFFERYESGGEVEYTCTEENPGFIYAPMVYPCTKRSVYSKLKKMPAQKYTLAVDQVCYSIPMPYRATEACLTTAVVVAPLNDITKESLMMLDAGSYVDFIFKRISEISQKLGKPERINVYSVETEDLLRDFCEKSGIKLRRVKTVPKSLREIHSLLEDIEELNNEDFDDDYDDDYDDDDDDYGYAPEAGSEIKISERKPSREPKSESCYVVSVSAGTGCYRHIRISENETLYDLSCAILEAFDFYNDHMHAFFMDNHLWGNDVYFSSENEDYPSIHDETTQQVLLKSVLSAGKKFMYVFDFGDEWEFSCRVLRTEQCEYTYPEIVRRVGASPVQYE